MNPEEPSLLSHLNDVRKRALDEGGITTIIYCGQVRSEADLMNALQIHRAIVEEEVNNEKVNVTGILMGQVRAFIFSHLSSIITFHFLAPQVNGIFHVLEGPSYSVLRILNNLAGHEQFLGQSPIQSGSIVYDTEDRPKRIYPEWFSCILSEQKAVEEVTKDNSEDIVFDMATKILELGNKLRTEAQDELDLER